MFTKEQRDHVRQYVLDMAKADPRVTGGALTGSTAFSAGDNWSDIDVAFGVIEGIALETVLDDWMQTLDREFGVLDHFDLLAGPSIYRVHLLPSGLEIDIAVTPAKDFGARGPQFRPLFGSSQKLQEPPSPDAPYHLIGLSWHHVLHARSSIERHLFWRAEYWISEIRGHVLTLACLRLGENPAKGRGIDRLPTKVLAPLTEALVRSLDEPELRGALAIATRCLLAEIEEWNPSLCSRLKPLLYEFGLSTSTN